MSEGRVAMRVLLFVMTEPTLAYNSDTGDVFVVQLPESIDDLGVPTECFKIGQLEPGLSDEEFRGANV
jgi:hypothetical protein